MRWKFHWKEETCQNDIFHSILDLVSLTNDSMFLTRDDRSMTRRWTWNEFIDGKKFLESSKCDRSDANQLLSPGGANRRIICGPNADAALLDDIWREGIVPPSPDGVLGRESVLTLQWNFLNDFNLNGFSAMTLTPNHVPKVDSMMDANCANVSISFDTTSMDGSFGMYASNAKSPFLGL